MPPLVYSPHLLTSKSIARLKRRQPGIDPGGVQLGPSMSVIVMQSTTARRFKRGPLSQMIQRCLKGQLWDDNSDCRCDSTVQQDEKVYPIISGAW